MKYRINEIFYSIQGEGFFTGTSAVFVRLAGCNLNCSFCDTEYKCKYVLNERDLIEAITKYESNHIILTGGEPALQLRYGTKGYDKFLGKLRDCNYFVQIETNGTIKLPNNIDWVTVSPKEIEYPDKLVVENGDAIKIVYQGQAVTKYVEMGFNHFYLQPCERDGKMNIEETINKVKENPEWKLSIQTQKLLKIR